MCGTANPRVIADYLDVSYQAAKNYLNGRLPESKVLIKISEKTPVSIHWLLTGEGDKFVDRTGKNEAELLAATLSEIASPKTLRKLFQALSEEMIDGSIARELEQEDKSRTITLDREKIYSEKTEPVKSAKLTRENR